MKTGIFGGTFDPVHIGHVRATEAFVYELALDRLFVLPNCLPPLKDKESASAEDRLAMLKIAFSDMEGVQVDDFELKNGGTSYTYKTIEHYRALFPQDRLFLLIGDDNLLIFRKWVNFDYIIKNCTICVAARSGADITRDTAVLKQKYNADIRVLSYTPTVISSTELRERLTVDLLPVGVYDFIREKGLYR
ncbi:MAG: nicotinate (nicotinamide) nucleotide adenylyltransferase [Firmicutes bacterium HGW-Firmicutes-21]|nr:MAG: nicotinate (nicotinamide) nucleotide adenylyltransferase [Firmicutes bacterium HGW-Firmicutes-21]